MPRIDPNACRVCGCTEHNACLDAFEQPCWWAKVEKNSPPLCSHCAGSEADVAEAIRRGTRALMHPTVAAARIAVAIGRAALRRKQRRDERKPAVPA